MTTTAIATRVRTLEPSPTLYGHPGEPIPAGCVLLSTDDLEVGDVLQHAAGTFDLVTSIDPVPSRDDPAGPRPPHPAQRAHGHLLLLDRRARPPHRPQGRGGAQRMTAPRAAVRRLSAARFASSGGTHAAQIALAFTDLRADALLHVGVGVPGRIGRRRRPRRARCRSPERPLDRRRVMVVAELAGAVGWLLVLLADRPLTLVLFALLATAANAPFKAAASASVPNLVPADDLPWANGTIATATNASLLVGPLVGGALVGRRGPQAVYALNVVSFLVSALVIARLRGTFAATGGTAIGRRRTLADGRRRPATAEAVRRDRAHLRRLRRDAGRGSPLGRPPRGRRDGLRLLTTLWGTGAIVGSSIAARIPARHELTR